MHIGDKVSTCNNKVQSGGQYPRDLPSIALKAGKAERSNGLAGRISAEQPREPSPALSGRARASCVRAALSSAWAVKESRKELLWKAEALAKLHQ